MTRKFLTLTARTQGQSIMYFRDPFKLSNLTDLAEAGDKFTRNEIMTSNEIRGKMGLRPSNSPDADELRNKNLNKANNPSEDSGNQEEYDEEDYDYDPDQEGKTLMRLYKITYGQLLDVWEQEGNRERWYNSLYPMGTAEDGIQVYTITSKQRKKTNQPSEKYKAVIK